MKPRKVLHVVNISFVLPYYFGDQFDYFQEKGIEFHVACSPSEHLEDYAKRKKFKAFPVAVLRKISPIDDLISLIKLVKYIKKNQIDVVVGHTPKGGLLGMLAAYLAGIEKRIYFRHGLLYETSKGVKRQILKSIEKSTGLLAKKVVCVSPSILEVSNQSGLSHHSKNIVLGHGTCNGIDVIKFDNKKDQSYASELSKKLGLEGSYVLGYVGRLVKDKGIIELIDAWKMIKSTHSNVKLLLVGPFEEGDKLPAEVIQFINTESSIIHVGLVDNTKIYYQLMDLFILPSHREGFGMVVLEASAMELPVITTQSTGCRNAIIPNHTGIFTRIDAEDIASKIQYYMQDRTIGKVHGSNGRAFVIEKFKQERVWQEIEDKVFNCL